MADKELAALTDIDAVADADSFPVRDASDSTELKEATAAQLATYVGSELAATFDAAGSASSAQAAAEATAAAALTAHGSADEHTQYHNDTRGDARYYLKAQVDAAIAQAVADLIDGAPGALDTLNELAASLGDDADFAATMTTALALKADEADAVMKALFDANTLLKADTDNTPAAMAVGEGTIVGRATGGSIAALTASQVRTLLGLVIGSDVQAYSATLSDIKDEDNMASDSATALATQQSIKAYVDANAGGGDSFPAVTLPGLTAGRWNGAVPWQQMSFLGQTLDGLRNNVGNANTSAIWFPCWGPEGGFDRIGISITTASDDVGSEIRGAIYPWGALPSGSLVEDLGTLALDSTGSKEWTCTASNTQGWFWFGIALVGNAAASTNPEFRSISVSTTRVERHGLLTSLPTSNGFGSPQPMSTISAGDWDSAAPSTGPSSLTSSGNGSSPVLWGRAA